MIGDAVNSTGVVTGFYCLVILFIIIKYVWVV